MVEIGRLIFDENNSEHIARHHVNEDEVEDVCSSRPLVLRGRQGRLAVFGQTLAGRYLLIILAPRRRAAYYVITARDMTATEKRHYRKRKGN